MQPCSVSAFQSASLDLRKRVSVFNKSLWILPQFLHLLDSERRTNMIWLIRVLSEQLISAEKAKLMVAKRLRGNEDEDDDDCQVKDKVGLGCSETF
jgi:hypothetical protein